MRKPSNAAGTKVTHDLQFILDEAEKHGTTHRLKDVAIYFTALELQTIVTALSSAPTTPAPAAGMGERLAGDCDRTITHDEAEASAQRLINSHFNQEPSARVGIPARPGYDDDLVIYQYIRQQRAAPPSGWRSIESAPRDKSDLWLANTKIRQIGFWERRNKEWVGSEDACRLSFTPTHFMELPALPLPPASGERG